MALTGNVDHAAQVDALLQNPQHKQHPLLPVVHVLRQVLNRHISLHGLPLAEQVKWNSLSWYFTGVLEDEDPKEYLRDVLVLNLHKCDQVLMIWPNGKRVDDVPGLFTGKFKDTRRAIAYTSVQQAEELMPALLHVLDLWLATLPAAAGSTHSPN